MDKSKLSEFITLSRRVDGFLNETRKIGLNMLNTTFYDDYVEMERLFITDMFGQEGYEVLMQYLYDFDGISGDTECRMDKFASDDDFCNYFIGKYHNNNGVRV